MNVRISGTGVYLPQKRVTTQEIFSADNAKNHNNTILEDELQQIEKSNGVQSRHVARDDLGETTSQMAAWAILAALKNAKLQTTNLDLIIFAGAAFEQPVPDTSVLIQLKLDMSKQGTPCFSIHATCLGFLHAMDIASAYIQSGRYQCIAIVCSEIASKAINPRDLHTYTLFGDAAAAVILTATTGDSQIHHSYITTFSEGAYYTEIIAGGTRKHPNHHQCSIEDHSFKMKGREILKFALPKSKEVLDLIWPNLSRTTIDLDHIITHQPSRIGLLAFQRFFPIEKTTTTLHRYGNCVSASLPLTLHDAIQEKQFQRGDKILLFGMGAGLSIGGMVLTY